MEEIHFEDFAILTLQLHFTPTVNTVEYINILLPNASHTEGNSLHISNATIILIMQPIFLPLKLISTGRGAGWIMDYEIHEIHNSWV